MFKKLFKKSKYSNITFLNELLKHDFDEEFLNGALESKDINIDYTDSDGNTFLHICLLRDKFKSALWLIQHNATTKIYNKNKQRAIDIAIEKENSQLLQSILLVNEIDLNKKDEEGRTLLQETVVNGHSEMAKILIDNGACVNSTDKQNRNVVFDALSFGDSEFIDYLTIQKDIELNNIDTNQNTIMHHSEVIKNDNIAVNLINAGADTTIKNKHGQTYLCDTALRGMDGYDIVDTALNHGADINSRVANNNTILMELIAATTKLSSDEVDRRKSLFEISKKILLKGIDKNAIDENNETALFKAVRVHDFELSAFLLSAGVNPNIQNHRKQTVLNYCVYQGVKALDVLLLLLKYKINLLTKDLRDRTIYEILNEIILHTHNKLKMNDRYILSLITNEGQYMRILKELLDASQDDLNFLDSTGNPLFFNPLLNDHFQLFKLYIKSGLDIHNVNIEAHNIFFEYVLKVFEDDNVDIDFQNNISMLLSAKLDQNFKDDTGYTIVHKILETKCNINLFDTLTQVVLFDYGLTDKMGRSVMHTAVWHDQQSIMQRMNNIDKKIVNIPDIYGILPISYAALLGSQELVLLFISMGANISSGIAIPKQAILKFGPMLKNLPKLRVGIENNDTLKNINMVIDQVQRDFKVL